MVVIWLIVKSIFLIIAIMYGFSNFAKVFRKLSITDWQILFMSIGVVGYIAIEYWLGF